MLVIWVGVQVVFNRRLEKCCDTKAASLWSTAVCGVEKEGETRADKDGETGARRKSFLQSHVTTHTSTHTPRQMAYSAGAGEASQAVRVGQDESNMEKTPGSGGCGDCDWRRLWKREWREDSCSLAPLMFVS